MPTPKKGQSKPDFIQECVPQLISEGKTTEEAVAICYSIYKEVKAYEQKDFTTISKIFKRLK